MKKLFNIIKKVIMRTIGGIVGFYALLYLLVFLPPSPFKVSNPTNPRFNIEKFQFNDYDSRDFGQAMHTLFPKGTKKEYMNHVLIDIGEATYRQSDSNYHNYSKSKLVNEAYIYDYYITHRCQDYGISACFNSNEEFLYMRLGAPCTMSSIGKECPK